MHFIIKKLNCLMFISLSLLFIISGCANKSAYVSQLKELGSFESFYVIRLEPDKRDLNKLIAQRLNEMGYVATAGEESSVPPNIGAIVTYQDRWSWDITNYMSRLNIQLRNPYTKTILATGHAYKSSMRRESPQIMIKEVLKSIFDKSISSEERLLLNAFYGGEASLVVPGLITGMSEALAYGSTVKERREYYDQGIWIALALNTLKINYGDNSAWFYLGRAAEEFGYTDAALKYYEKSIELSKSFLTSCIGPVCSGFTFPDDPQLRIKKIQEELNK